MDARKSQTTKMLLEGSQIIAIAGIVVAVAASLINKSAPVGIWLIINQIQLISLLVLTGAYMTPAAKEILIGSEYTSFTFSFIPVLDIPVINIPLKELHFDQEDVNLKKMGLKSGSSLTSNAVFLIIMVILVLLHLLTLLIPRLNQNQNESTMRRTLRQFRTWIDTFMGFTVYVRLYIEVYQYMLLSSISELNTEKTNTTENLISYVLAVLFLLICLLGALFVYFITKANMQNRILAKDRFISRFQETFAGLKATKEAKIYIFISMFLRKLFYISVMIWIAPLVDARHILQLIAF